MTRISPGIKQKPPGIKLKPKVTRLGTNLRRRLKAEADEIPTLLPDFSLERERQRRPYRNPADMERYIGGLRKAGLE